MGSKKISLPLSPNIVASLVQLPLLGVTQAAAVIGIPESTLDMLLYKTERGYIAPPFFKMGRLLKVRTSDLLAWIDSRAREGAGHREAFKARKTAKVK
jgi:hypothetical protein